MGEPARQTTQLTLLCCVHAVILAVFAWDVYMMSTGHNSDTVSSIVREWSQAYPELLLPVGYLICHLFGR